ncbi:hypothetical protein [Streptomyces sp. NPDC004267]|uniref:hypothetical protein n=1 Tax=Streptomyces sp. NPDC004267 TaxID=3364694 RepID=UPI0036B84142
MIFLNSPAMGFPPDDGCGQLPSVGAVVKAPRPSLPWFVVDAVGRGIERVSRYLRDLALGDASALTGRSYGYGLLCWLRVLWAVVVGWEQAAEAETAAMVGWLRTVPAVAEPERWAAWSVPCLIRDAELRWFKDLRR